MITRKIAAFVVSSIVIVAPSQVAARNTGNTVFDECVIACLDSGGGVGGDGRMCNLICARDIEDTQPGPIKGTTPGPPPTRPGPGCPPTGSRICTDKL